MAGGLPGDSVYKIPVKLIATETYLAVYEHRRRIARQAIVRLILCVVLSLVKDGIKSHGTGNVYFYLIFQLLVLLVPVPYQVAIHRLTYPEFDFDQGSYGPPIKIINISITRININYIVLHS